jgi:hypothetical protein
VFFTRAAPRLRAAVARHKPAIRIPLQILHSAKKHVREDGARLTEVWRLEGDIVAAHKQLFGVHCGKRPEHVLNL